LPSLEEKFPLDKRPLFIYMSIHQNKFTRGKTITNKSDLIATLAAKENLTEKQATEIINLSFDGFMNTLKKID